ncbi:hypothetical protein D3C81_1878410 [compost metagenome]
MLPVRQLAAVQRQKGTGLGLAREEVVGWHHHIVAGAPGQQLAFQGFVGVEHVIDHLDPAAGLEVGQGGVADVVGPVVHADRGGGVGGGGEQQGECGGDQGLQMTHGDTSLVLFLAFGV